MRKKRYFVKHENDWTLLGDELSDVQNFLDTNHEAVEGEASYFKCASMTDEEVEQLPEE